MKEAREEDLRALIAAVSRTLAHRPPSPARERGTGGEVLYLVGNTSHLAEGWRARVPQLELAGVPAAGLLAAVREAGATLEVAVVWESPADVIPLPSGWAERARAAPAALHDAGGRIAVRHFDPYSVVLRLVARGDEPDYMTALEYLRNGWVEPQRLEALLDDVLPRFTSATLAQDPAEFRRKYRGLRQLHVATSGAPWPARQSPAGRAPSLPSRP